MVIIRRITFIWIALFGLLCLLPSFSQAATESLPENHPVYRQVQTVYERLMPAFGEGRLPPRLVVVPTGVKTHEPVYPFELDAETRLLNHEQQGQRAARAGQADDNSARIIIYRNILPKLKLIRTTAQPIIY